MTSMSHGLSGGSARVGGTAPKVANGLHGWLYEVHQDGTSEPIWDDYGRPLHKVTRPRAILRVSVRGGGDTEWERHLKVPSMEGMAVEPVTVARDAQTGFWVIRNGGRTNTLRVQQYGLGAVPLLPGASIAMAGEDVAVWIPVKPAQGTTNKAEAFRLLVLRSPQPPRPKGVTMLVTGSRYSLTPAMWEALVMYFGEYLSWPPLVMPHIRGDAEVKSMAAELALARETDTDRWVRNRHAVLAGRDGLFTAPSAAWYPRLGGADRTLGNHLAAFHRLVELGTINLHRAYRSALRYNVGDYIMIDGQLVPEERGA